MSTTGSRGEFTTGDTKGFNYSLLMEDEELEQVEEIRNEDAVELEKIEVPEVVVGAQEEGDVVWSTFHKPIHQRKESTGTKTFGHFEHRSSRSHSNATQPQQSGFTGGINGTNGPNHQARKTRNQIQPHERKPIILSSETTVEIYDFPTAFHTNDIRKLLSGFEGKYRIKWNNDNSCWAVFNEAQDAEEALKLSGDESYKIRKYTEESDKGHGETNEGEMADEKSA